MIPNTCFGGGKDLYRKTNRNEKIKKNHIFKEIEMCNKKMNKDQVPTVFSVTTENFNGTINDAPPPIDIPCTRATCQSTSTSHFGILVIKTQPSEDFWKNLFPSQVSIGDFSSNFYLGFLVRMNVMTKPIHSINHFQTGILCHKSSELTLICYKHRKTHNNLSHFLLSFLPDSSSFSYRLTHTKGKLF